MTRLTWIIDPGLGMHPGDRTTVVRGSVEPLDVDGDIASQAAEIVRQYGAADPKPTEVLVDIAAVGSAMYHELMQAGLPVAAFRIVARSPAYRALTEAS